MRQKHLLMQQINLKLCTKLMMQTARETLLAELETKCGNEWASERHNEQSQRWMPMMEVDH